MQWSIVTGDAKRTHCRLLHSGLMDVHRTQIARAFVHIDTTYKCEPMDILSVAYNRLNTKSLSVIVMYTFLEYYCMTDRLHYLVIYLIDFDALWPGMYERV